MFSLVNDAGVGVVDVQICSAGAGWESPTCEIGTESARVSWDKCELRGRPDLYVDLAFSGHFPLLYLAPTLNLQPVRAGAIVDSSTGGFVLVTLGGQSALGISLHGMRCGRWISSRVFRAYVSKEEANPLPHVEHALSLYSRETACELSIRWAVRSPHKQGWLYPYRYQNGHRSAFCVTDHADFDDPRKYAALIGTEHDGLASQGVKISKSVFVSRGIGKTACKINLGIEKWRRQIVEWSSRNWIEMGLHLTRPLPAPRSETLEDLDQVADLNPRFWIDHGVNIPQAIWEGGGIPSSEHFIWDELLRRGITTFWNRRDIWDEAPGGQLNLLGPRTSRFRPEFLKILDVHEFADPRTWKAFLNRCFDPAVSRGIRRVLQGLIHGTPRRVFQGFPEMAQGIARSLGRGSGMILLTDQDRFLSPVYRGHTLRAGGAPPLFFSSQLVREPVLCWSEENIRRLVREGGLHIAHTYLGQSKRVPLLEEGKGGTILSKEFKRVVQNIGEHVRRGELWSPGISELVESLAVAFDMRITRDQHTDSIYCPGPSHGVRTLLLLCGGTPQVEAPHEFIEQGELRLLRLAPGPDRRPVRAEWGPAPSGLGQVHVRIQDRTGPILRLSDPYGA